MSRPILNGANIKLRALRITVHLRDVEMSHVLWEGIFKHKLRDREVRGNVQFGEDSPFTRSSGRAVFNCRPESR